VLGANAVTGPRADPPLASPTTRRPLRASRGRCARVRDAPHHRAVHRQPRTAERVGAELFGAAHRHLPLPGRHGREYRQLARGPGERGERPRPRPRDRSVPATRRSGAARRRSSSTPENAGGAAFREAITIDLSYSQPMPASARSTGTPGSGVGSRASRERRHGARARPAISRAALARRPRRRTSSPPTSTYTPSDSTIR
jgi:hypothetical protein